MATAEHRFTLNSNYDNLKLYAVSVIPESPCALMAISHGMCEHKERYLDFMRYLAVFGIASVIHDHRGHGQSIKKYPDDLGYFYEGGYKALIEDLKLVFESFSSNFPDVPKFMLSHSMGSLAARCFIKKYDYLLDGLFLCGSPNFRKGASFGLLATKILSSFFGDKVRSKSVQKLLFGSFNNKFDGIISENDWICSNPKTVEAFDGDDLCGVPFTLNGYKNLLLMFSDVYSKDGWLLRNPHLPIYFLSGSEDPCFVSIKRLHKSMEFLENAGYKNISFKVFPKMRHEILNENDNKSVYTYITNSVLNISKKHRKKGES